MHWIRGLRRLSCSGALAAGCSLAISAETTTANTEASAPPFQQFDVSARAMAEREHIPGLAMGLMREGKLVHAFYGGSANLEEKIPVTSDTRFRIASMTKSFIALAILKLRDEGILRLGDDAAHYVPELRMSPLPTTDSPVVTIERLLAMNAGLPEDNPWGDRRLAMTPAEFTAFLQAGISFSTSPGQTYEYSNLGYMILGRIITNVSGLSYQEYIRRNILLPLGMNHTEWEFSVIPAATLARGYLWRGNEWEAEPMQHDGDGAACGGLITTLGDFARYVAYLLQASPARDGTEIGPVRRSSLREMQQLRRVIGVTAAASSGEGDSPGPAVRGYGYGLTWQRTSEGEITLGHAGRLPGFGCGYVFRPDIGTAVIVFANLRTQAAYVTAQELLRRLSTAPDAPPGSRWLDQRCAELTQLLQSWDDNLAARIFAPNFFEDHPQKEWIESTHRSIQALGDIESTSPLVPLNRLRGSFSLIGQSRRLEVFFSLTPEKIPRIQAVRLTAAPVSPP